MPRHANCVTSVRAAVRTAVGAAACTAFLAAPAPAPAQSHGPLWTRGATCYEVFVRSFYDSDGDGIGDLKGLTEKLDYINDGDPRSTRDLGARCIWLMPVAESPSYHGYDVTDYYHVEHDYGTNDDFRRLVAAAHRRGIEVIVDMVLNHTSDRNPWFQAALHDTTSPYRSWYRFSPTPLGKGPWGQDAWHRSPVRDEYYYGVFWKDMPDLDYETPAVRAEAKKIARFWLEDMGADGFRLDAVQYLMEDHGKLAGSPGTHEFLHEYQAYVDSIRPGTYTVGEVNGVRNDDELVPYYPEQLWSYFAFEVTDSMIAAVNEGSAKALYPSLIRLQRDVPQSRFATFLSNHDQTRTRTKLGGDVARARVAAILLLTLPGVPYVYYGDEIGMMGDKPDPRIRTPMQWSAGAGGGFTRGKPWEPLQPDSQTVTVAAEDRDPGSLLNLYRRLIHLRARSDALSGGRLIPLTTSSDAVAAYVRRDGDRAALVVVNLSRAPLREVSLSSPTDALPAGRWALRDLLGSGAETMLTVGRDGKLTGYVPLRTLAPMRGWVLDLTPAR